MPRPRKSATQAEQELIDTTAEIDRIEGRIIRYAKKLDTLRTKRKRLQRGLALSYAGFGVAK